MTPPENVHDILHGFPDEKRLGVTSIEDPDQHHMLRRSQCPAIMRTTTEFGVAAADSSGVGLACTAAVSLDYSKMHIEPTARTLRNDRPSSHVSLLIAWDAIITAEETTRLTPCSLPFLLNEPTIHDASSAALLPARHCSGMSLRKKVYNEQKTRLERGSELLVKLFALIRSHSQHSSGPV
ncbi:MAG: hypothetical protein HY420_05350 [Candidatus Kerfeldbacteria bacterium]|nr:hypothetical protein [Candidatus Kerfeldbacteria bacterium]